MKQIRSLGDERVAHFCTNCANHVETRDHVPPKVFLDEPYPENLPVVPMCRSCNLNSSKDEEYLACLIECVIAGKCDGIKRSRIQRILEGKPGLKVKLQKAMRVIDGNTFFEVEQERMRNVVLKVANGLAMYELHSPQYDQASEVAILPLSILTEEQLDKFEMPPMPVLWPEVGSRGMDRLARTFPYSEWIIVQPNNFRYLAYMGPRMSIRMVIREYLACEIIW